ncbi:MAG: FkbM family methyltransferase [Opitutales bacterium]|nr:FkbM family methyltransferase [Opitutales bacterium]
MKAITTLKFIKSHPLTKRKVLKAILRILKWQISSRMIDGSIVFNWIEDSKFIVKRGDTGLTGNIYSGLHEFYEMGFLLHFLREDDLFLDVGANVGSYTILAGKVNGSRCISIEPIESTFRRLKLNIVVNSLEERIQILKCGTGEKSKTVGFTHNLDTMNHVVEQIPENSSSITKIEIRKIDEILEGQCPSLIKIDVEGYEVPTLTGAEKTLQNTILKAIIIETNGSGKQYGYNDEEILTLLRRYNFTPFHYNPITRELFKLNGKSIQSGNTLFLRDEETVRERLHSAKKIIVNGTEF